MSLNLLGVLGNFDIGCHSCSWYCKAKTRTIILFHRNKLISNSSLNLELWSTVPFLPYIFFSYVCLTYSNYKTSKWAFQNRLRKESSSIWNITIKIIQEYDKQVAKEGKVNKAHLHRNMGWPNLLNRAKRCDTENDWYLNK